MAVREPGHSLHHLTVKNPFLRDHPGIDGWRRLVGQRPLGPLQTTGSTVVVEGGVACDLEQPRGWAGVPRLEAAVGLERLHEHLGRDVLRVRGAAELRPKEGVDPFDVFSIEVLKGWLRAGHGPVW